jgi:hypothetical protein
MAHHGEIGAPGAAAEIVQPGASCHFRHVEKVVSDALPPCAVELDRS